MTFPKALLLSFGGIAVSVLLAHFFAPYGLLLSLAVAIAVSAVIVSSTMDVAPLVRCVALAAALILLDVGIRLFSGGKHDSAGAGIVWLLFMSGAAVAWVVLVIGVLRSSLGSPVWKGLAMAAFPLILFLYYWLFPNLGHGRYYWYEWN